jgi:hypothetical protein
VNDPRRDWLNQLPQQMQQRAETMLVALEQAGCDQPHEWVRSELTEDIPQLARYRFLHVLWSRMIDVWNESIENLPAVQRAVEAGAHRDDLTQLARTVAYETVFAMLYHLADDDPSPAAAHLPGWALIEIDPVTCNPTGRSIDALYESLLALDPSGREGRDLWY